MSMINRLLDQLRKRGLEVVAGDGPDGMKLRGPAEEKTPDVIALLKRFKPELLEMIHGKKAEVKPEQPPAGESGPRHWS